MESLYQPGINDSFPFQDTWEPFRLMNSRPNFVDVTDVVGMTRRCSRCHDIKPLNEFHVSQSQCMGRTYWCKDCKNAAERERRSNAA